MRNLFVKSQNDVLEVEQNLIKRIKKICSLYSEEIVKKYWIVYDKRVIIGNDTLRFGY